MSAIKWLMNQASPNCCRRADCADVNCPGRGTQAPKQEAEPTNPAGAEAAIKYVLNVLAGIGIGAFIVAVLIWSAK